MLATIFSLNSLVWALWIIGGLLLVFGLIALFYAVWSRGLTMLLIGGLIFGAGILVNSSYTPKTLAGVVKLMEKIDVELPKPEFNVTHEPLRFTWLAKHMTAKSLETWRTVAEQQAKAENDTYAITGVTSIEFHSDDEKTIEEAVIYFKGKKDKAEVEEGVIVERQSLPENDTEMIKDFYRRLKAMEKNPTQPPALTGGKANVPLPKASRIVPKK